jgi:two-component system response regulator HydG
MWRGNRCGLGAHPSRPSQGSIDLELQRTTGVLTSILVVDHDIEFAELICDGLRDRRYLVAAVHSAREAISYLEQHPVDIVVAHIHLREISGLELVASLRDRQSEVLGIVVTSHGSLETAVDAIRAGAYDFITKPVTLGALEVAIDRAVAYQKLRREVQTLRIAVATAQPVDTILGDSPAIREVTTAVRRVAESPATVLVTGESGTGKELVARAIHDLSERRHEPFIAINCGALPPALLESELFGHVRGAFTDARQNRNGLFVQADAVPRRDRRDAARDAGQVVARAAGADVAARRW